MTTMATTDTTTTDEVAGATEATAATGATGATGVHAVTGLPRLFLRIEGAAALVAGAALYLHLGGWVILLVPLLLLVDVSMLGYLAGPRVGALVYNVAHDWALGLAVLGLAWWLASPALALAGAILVAHTGMDRVAGYGLKYPTAFGDTHLGRIGKGPGARGTRPRAGSAGPVEAVR
jgi:hypothetical protein